MEAVKRPKCCYERFGNTIFKREIRNREKLKNGLSYSSYYTCVGAFWSFWSFFSTLKHGTLEDQHGDAVGSAGPGNPKTWEDWQSSPHAEL